MNKLYYQFPNTWFGDCMPFGHGKDFYLYHQRDTRKPGLEFTEGTRSFGVRFYENEENAESYQYMFHVPEDRYVFEKYPNWPWPANQNIGLERPINLIPGKKYNIRLIVDDTIGTLYVDGVALNARAYNKVGESFSLFASEGSLKVTNCIITKGLK